MQLAFLSLLLSKQRTSWTLNFIIVPHLMLNLYVNKQYQGKQWRELFNVHGSVHRKNILIYIQQDATLHSLFYLEAALHVSRGNTAHHQERKQLYLQHLVFVRPLLLPAAIAASSSNGVTTKRCCRHSCLFSWWWVMVPPETCREVFR
jgi:hypothetical protein